MGGNCNNGELSGNRNPDGLYNSGGLSGSRNLGGDYNNGGRGYPRENDRYDVMAETAGGGVGSMRDPSMNKAPPRAQVLPELGEKNEGLRDPMLDKNPPCTQVLLAEVEGSVTPQPWMLCLTSPA